MTDKKITLADLDAGPLPPHLAALHEHTRNKAAEFSLHVARARDAFYWKMIAAGWLPSQGWRVSERLVEKDGRMTVEHTAIPPKHGHRE